MPGIVLILIMVFLVTLWIMGVYVDVRNTHRQNGHNSGSELVKTEIVQKDSQKRKPAFLGENIEKEGLSSQGSEEKARENMSLRGSRTLLSLPTGQAPQEDNPSPDPDPVDIPRERMRFLRTFREEEPVPESEEAHDTLIPDSPENTGNSPAVLDSMSEEEFDPSVHHKDESIQAEPSLENQATQTDFNKRDIAIGDPLLTEDAAIQALPSRHDVSLGSHISQHEQEVQYSALSINLEEAHEEGHSLSSSLSQIHDGSCIITRGILSLDKAVQPSFSLEMSDSEPSLTRGVFALDKAVQLTPPIPSDHEPPGKNPFGSQIEWTDREDHLRRSSLQVKSIGLDPRSFHMSDYSPLSSSPPASDDILDKIPLVKSINVSHEEEKQPSIRIPPLRLEDIPLQESILIEPSKSSGSRSFVIVDDSDASDSNDWVKLSPRGLGRKPQKDEIELKPMH